MSLAKPFSSQTPDARLRAAIDSETLLKLYLLLGRVSQQISHPSTGALRLPVGDTSDVEGSEGALNNPESHTFGFPVMVELAAYCRCSLGCMHVVRFTAILGGPQCHCRRRPAPRRLTQVISHLMQEFVRSVLLTKTTLN
jgi:hypothetical protein